MKSDLTTTKGVKFISLYESSGYATAAKRYLLGLKNSGIHVTWTPMIQGTGWKLGYEPFIGKNVDDPEMAPYCNIRVDYSNVIVHTVPEYYPIWAKYEPNKKIIGYTVWETDRTPQHWPALLNKVDHLLVPCNWNKEVFRKCGVTVPIDVVPHIMSNERPAEGCRFMDVSPDDYVFYTIGTWTVRKAIWHTIECYLNTFTGNDPTVLIVKTTRKDFTKLLFGRFRDRTWRLVNKMSRKRKKPARIKLVTEEITDGEILNLHGRGDCYVSLTRSEGWGLGAFDAASFGKPVIMTGFGGQLDYLPGEFAYLVDFDLIPVFDKLGKKSYSEDQTWAEPKLQHASQLMRNVFNNREEAKARGQALRKYIYKNYSETQVMRKLLSVISRH